MELNLLKHHYFVTVSFRWIYDRKGSMFIHCSADDVENTIMSKLHEVAKNVCIETITKLD